MRILQRWFLALLLSAAFLPAGAFESQAPDQLQLVPFATEEGLIRLARAGVKAPFGVLANQFEAQSNAAFCGPTSAAIILNAVHAGAAELPRDRSRLRPEDLRYLPAGIELAVPRYTQDSVIGKGAKTRAQVLGEPILVAGKQVQDIGYQLRQFDELLRANGLRTTMVIVEDQKPEEQVREDIVRSLRQSGNYVVVNYARAQVGQKGGGHISPLGAYDEHSDSVLVLDVNPASAGWVWMPVRVLLRGMRTFDTVENRGYVLVHAP